LCIQNAEIKKSRLAVCTLTEVEKQMPVTFGGQSAYAGQSHFAKASSAARAKKRCTLKIKDPLIAVKGISLFTDKS